MKKYRGRKSFDTAPLSIIQNSSPPQILFCLFFISQFKSKCLQTFYLTTSPFVLIFVKLRIYKKNQKKIIELKNKQNFFAIVVFQRQKSIQ